MVRTVTELDGCKSSWEERECLANAGFVHVTGLVASFPEGDHRKNYIIGGKTTAREFGTSYSNNSKTVVVTEGGEIWVKAQTGETSDFDKIHGVVEKLNLERGGTFVPLSNGEETDLHLLLLRVADPDYGIQYKKH
jgi:hypothetical protein